MHMKLNFKRLMAMLLSVIMVVSMMATMVFATSLDDLPAEFNNGTGDVVLGGDLDLGGDASDPGVNAPAAPVAKIGDQYYTTLADALAANVAGDVVLLAPYVVEAGETVILNLNGKTVVYNSTTQGEAMITNKGNLTINDSVGTGVINYNYTGAADPSYGKGNYTISNGGTLTVNGGKITIANLSGHAKYPIDNNSTTGDAILVINGGHLYNYNTSAIRQFCNSPTNKNSVTINGGLIEGYCAIWVQNPGKNTVNGTLSITGGEIKTTAKAYVNGTSALKDVSSRIYCTTEGGAWDDASAVSITGGTINENVNLAENAPADITTAGTAKFNGYVEAPAREGLEGSGTVADPYLISSVNDFILFAKKVQAGDSFSGKIVKLANDIDFAGANFLEIAEDGTIVTDYRLSKFSGTFDGDNHTIKNFNFVVKSAFNGHIMMFSSTGGYEVIKNLKIENVTVNVADITGETRITALANLLNVGGKTGAAVENVHIKNYTINCTNTTSSNLRIGGFAYFAQGSQLVAKDCSIENFTVNANSAILVGGAVSIVKSKCDFINVDVINAKFNIGNMTNVAGGFTGQTQDNGTGTTFTDCDVNVHMNFGTIATDIGGFVASIGAASQFYNCTTSGTITVTGEANGKSVGGFVGDLGWNGMGAPNTQHEFNNCVADVDITVANANVGGFIGDSTITGYPERFIPAYFNNCEAKGDVKTESGVAGGFAGRGDRGIFNACSASGNVEGRIAGGFWGELYPKAAAESKGGWSYDKKEVTHTDANAKTIVLQDLEVTGTVTGTEYTAGLIGFVKDVYVDGNNEVGYATPIVMEGNNKTDFNRYDYPQGTVEPLVAVAQIGDVKYATLAEAFAAAAEGDTIVLLADAAPALMSQRRITNAAVIDLNGKTLTLTEDDLYFGTTTFKNGTIVVDPSVKASTAVFWMFANQTLTFDNVKLVATGVSGTYLIGLDGNNSDLNLLNGSEIVVENTTALDLDIICVNASTGNDIVIENSKVNVTNLDGRVFFRGNYTVSGTSEIALEGITKAGFRIEAGQTLSIEDTASVTVVGNPRDGGIHLTDFTATYTKADTATVNATVNKPAVATVNGVGYATLAEALAAAKSGDEVKLIADVTEDVTAPAGIIFNGNGFAVNGSLSISGDITFAGHTKVTSFSAGYYNRTITIGAGACLEITGTGRVTLGYGNIFNITGTIADAKTADKTQIKPSLIIPGGMSITGGNDATMNVTNAYVVIGSTSSKNSAANGKFTLNFDNSIAEFTNQLTLSEPTGGNNPTFIVNVKDSVLTTGTKFIIAAPNTTAVIDNSVVTLATYFRNSGNFTLKNGSVMTGATIQFGENGGNNGTITVDNSKFTIKAGSTGHAFDGKGTGKIVLTNGAQADVDYLKDMAIDLANGTFFITKTTETLTVTAEAGYEAKYDGEKYIVVKAPVAEINGVKYATLVDAFKAATNGSVIEILADVVIDGKWDCRDYATNGSHSQFKESVTINGNGHTIKFTGTISDGNWNTIFRFEENATVNNLTIDISEATGAQRVISAKKSLTVDGLTIIGNAKYGIIFGEGASAADLADAEIVITDSTLTGTRRAISDNEGGKDVKSVTITGNKLNANVYASASDSIIFNNNVANGEVDLRSYAANNVLSVEAKDNTLTAGVKNYIYANTIDAQVEFTAQRPAFKVATKAELDAALAAAEEGDVIVLIADIDYGTTQLAITKAITLDLGGYTLTTANAYGGMSVKNNPTIKNGTIVHASNTAAIKVWNATAFEDLVIDVQGKGDANKTIGGIVLQSGSTTRVGSIKNVTIKGEALTNGIETYNCGDAAQNVIGSMENVTIDANGTGMLISAPCGTATNCSINGDVCGIEISIKGTYSASLDLVDCDVVGGVYSHDEFSSAEGIVNNGTLSLTADSATTGVDADDITLTIARAENVKGILEDIMSNAVAKVNNTYYATFAEAIAAISSGDVEIELLADATLDYGAREAYGRDTTTDIIIDGQGFTLTLNQTNSDWSSIGMANEDGKLTLKNMTIEKTGYGDTSGAWNTHAIIFSCNVEMNAVTVNNGFAVQNGATLNNVTINEAGDYYGLWINGNGQEVTVTGGSITATNGRGIKIADQYIDAPASVNLTVSGTEFTTAKKAAVLVSSTAGAAITASNVDISGVVADSTNFVWVDEDWADYNDDVTVTGGTKFQEGTVYVAQVGDVKYTDLQAALDAAKGETNIVITLLDDAVLDITAWETLAIGGDTTTSITINGNDKTLTFNKLNSDWNHITTKNGAKLILNNMTITDSGYNDGPWNRYDLVFACDVELNSVTATKALAFKADATLNDVEITEAGDNYAIWIQPNGQTVAIDGLTVTSAGRGIKIDNQYVDAPGKVTLTVEDATFTTAKKAAILVKTPAGADITLSNVDISNVAADTVNAVWNDEDNADYFNMITVTGGTIAQEGAKVGVAKIGDQYYESVAEALKAAADGATVELIWSEGDAPIAMNGYVSGKTVTITGTAQVDWEKGYLFVGRTNDGTTAADATLIFENATLTTTQGGDHGIHVSGAENGSATKADGTVKFVNSTVNLSYLINKGAMELDNSTLTVKSGFSIGGRPADETVSGEDATATISLTNGSKVVVDNHNGMGLGYEAIGIMNVDKTSSFETLKSFLVTAKGTMNLAGTAKVAGTLTNNGSIVLTDAAATLTSSECGGVTTTVDGYKVAYADDKYALAKTELFKLSGANIKIDSSLTMFFYIPKEKLESGINYYATITKANVGGEATVVQIPMDEWESYNNALYRVAFDELMAYMMNDEIKVQIFDADANAVSEIWTDSISIYAHRIYDKQNDKYKTALVDMLNYGAACQTYFGYDKDNLANKNLSEAQKNMASTDPTLTDNRIKGDNYHGSSLTCDSTLILQFYFTNINDSMTAKITYTNAYGTVVTETIAGSEFNKRTDALTGVKVGIAAYDAQQLVKCEVYNGDTLVASASDSVESYVARMSSTDGVFATIMKFALSSKNALID